MFHFICENELPSISKGNISKIEKWAQYLVLDMIWVGLYLKHLKQDGNYMHHLL
jgi:hypothetical protein